MAVGPRVASTLLGGRVEIAGWLQLDLHLGYRLRAAPQLGAAL